MLSDDLAVIHLLSSINLYLVMGIMAPWPSLYAGGRSISICGQRMAENAGHDLIDASAFIGHLHSHATELSMALSTEDMEILYNSDLLIRTRLERLIHWVKVNLLI